MTFTMASLDNLLKRDCEYQRVNDKVAKPAKLILAGFFIEY
ncbi:MAG: hypothetical protein ACI9JO_001446 [Psychrobacter okhotskensis]|jgi:hypothetical protein